MSEPTDLATQLHTAYYERKRQIAKLRATITDALLMSQECQDRGDLVNAQAWSAQAFFECDDLNALLEAWNEDFPGSGPDGPSGVAVT